MIDFSSFDEFQGEKPFRLLDQHPDGLHLAMQVNTFDVFSAAVWNKKTKQTVWSPEDAHALAWLQQGTQIAALQNPMLSEDFLFALYSWPQSQLIQQCPLHFPMGYLFDLVISPKYDFAVCQWTEQCEFGFEFININNNQAITHIAQNGYINRKTNISTRPVFSPDGHLWVCCYQENTSWQTDKYTFDQENRSIKKNQQQIGAVIVFHRDQKWDEFPIIPLVTVGDFPQNQTTPDLLEDIDISDPVFVDPQHIMIHLHSGESQIHDLSRFWA